MQVWERRAFGWWDIARPPVCWYNLLGAIWGMSAWQTVKGYTDELLEKVQRTC